MPIIPKTPYNIRQAYAQSLEAAGLTSAMQNIDTLLDDGYQETFLEYFPAQTAFNAFVVSFGISVLQVLKALQWSFDEDKFYTKPTQKQSIKNYFDSTFKPAVLATEIRS